MAITSSAKRAIRVSKRKRLLNVRRVEHMRDEVKAIKKLALSGKSDEAKKALANVYKAIDKSAKRGVIKKNTAARKKSRLVRFLKKQVAKPATKKVGKTAKA